MTPRGLEEGDKELPLKPAPWTNQETEDLHKLVKKIEVLEVMVDEYEKMQWLKKKALTLFVWGLGIPAALVYFFEPFERLIKLFSRLKGN